MRFNLLDRILAVEPGRRIEALKLLTRGEEYLADHFPTFPVMPGVLMLQALVEAGSWLLRVSDDFRFSVVVLREAKNVKYGNFMEPGRSMRISVEMTGSNGATAEFKGKGETEGGTAVAARFTLGQYNIGDRWPGSSAVDDRLVGHWRDRYAWLKRPAAPEGASVRV